MNLTVHTTEQAIILELDGRFDVYEAPTVKAWFEQNLGEKPIIVDLGNVIFIDSTALSVLVNAMKRCRQAKHDLILCGLNDTVIVIFQLTRLDKVFRVTNTTDEALQLLATS